MKTRFLLLFLTSLLGCQLTASGQTCPQKIAQCQQGCTNLSNPKLAEPCRQNCIKTACGTRQAPIPVPSSSLPWDVVAPNDGTEQPGNGFLRNPQWEWAIGNPASLLDVCDSCPCSNQDPSAWNVPNCTSQSLHKNGPQTLNPVCFIGGGNNSYHMNWFPVEIDGSLRYEDHSTVFDNDYQFDILSPNRSLITKSRGEVHVEFDSTETVNDWDQTGTWWDNFHHNVVDSLKDKDKIQSWFGHKSAIVIGMLGIDLEHGPHSELHPVYAIFINLGPEGPGPAASAAIDHWAFFVRNWGNEGYCGSGDEPLNDFTQIGIPLPETDIVRSSIWAYAHGDYSVDQCFAQTHVSSPDAKGMMVFDLPPASGKCGVVGDLFIRRSPSAIGGWWASAPGSSRPATLVPVSDEADEDIDPRLMAGITKLEPVARQELYKQLSDIMNEPSNKPNKPSRPMNLAPPARSGLAGRRPLYTGRGLKATPNPAYEARQAKQRQLIAEFLKAHGVQ